MQIFLLFLNISCFLLAIVGLVSLWRRVLKLERRHKPKPAVKIYINGQKAGKMSNLKVNKPASASVKFLDDSGNDAVVDGKPEWSVTDTTLADLVVSDDGMSCAINPKGLLGSFQLQCSADADMGEGVKAIVGVADITWIAAEATVVQISVSQLA